MTFRVAPKALNRDHIRVSVGLKDAQRAEDIY